MKEPIRCVHKETGKIRYFTKSITEKRWFGEAPYFWMVQPLPVEKSKETEITETLTTEKKVSAKKNSKPTTNE